MREGENEVKNDDS